MIDIAKTTAIIDDYKDLDGGLLECLHGLQAYFGYVPNEAIDIIADAFNFSGAEVHGVISYYHDFKTSPMGKKIVRVCQAEACQSMGSRQLSNHVKERLGIDFGKTDADLKHSLEVVYCFGNCALSPNIEIDGKLYGRATPEKFDKLISKDPR